MGKFIQAFKDRWDFVVACFSGLFWLLCVKVHHSAQPSEAPTETCVLNVLQHVPAGFHPEEPQTGYITVLETVPLHNLNIKS